MGISLTREFMIAALAAIAAAAVVFTLGFPFLGRGGVSTSSSASSASRSSAKRCAPRRWRACAAASAGQCARHNAPRRRPRIRQEHRRSLLAAEDVRRREHRRCAGPRRLSRAGAAQHLRVLPASLRRSRCSSLAFAYLSLTIFHDKPLYLNAIYALFLGLIGAYLPTLMLQEPHDQAAAVDQARLAGCTRPDAALRRGRHVGRARLQARRQGDRHAERRARRRDHAHHRRAQLPRRPHPRLRQSRQAHRPRRGEIGDDLADPGRSLRHQRRHRRCASWPRKAARRA